jgi:hypothetical protein
MSNRRISRKLLVAAMLAVGLGVFANRALAQFVGPLPFDPFNPRQTLLATNRTTTSTVFLGPTTAPSSTIKTVTTGFVGPLPLTSTDTNTSAGTTTDGFSSSDSGGISGTGSRPPVRDPFRPPVRSPFRP